MEFRSQARISPDDLVRRAPRITLDEVQREPNLILAVKRAVDEQRPRRPGRFILTGSANLFLMRRISETLAGRPSYVTLWPFSRRERLGLGTSGIWAKFFDTPMKDWYDMVRAERIVPEDWREAAQLGGYPTPALELAAEEARRIWFSGYVQTYLERDLQDLAAIGRLVDFQRLMRAVSLGLGTLVNQAEIGRDAGIPRVTVQRYIHLLETSYQILRLETYAVNRTKRLIKAPKVYWADTALALFLAGLDEPGGAHFENLVLADLIAWRDAQVTRPQIRYWRTAAGHEVDFVIDHQRRLLPIEVKTTARPSHHDIRHLQTFCQEYPQKVSGALLLHTGDEISWLGKGILAAPWWRIL